MTQAVIRFVLDQEHLRIRNVHDPAWLGLLVKLQKSHRQTIGVGVVAGLQIHPLLFDVPSPLGERQPAFHVRAGLEEGGHRWAIRIEGGRFGRRLKPKGIRTATRGAARGSITLPATGGLIKHSYPVLTEIV
jgi:hypothetical protein